MGSVPETVGAMTSLERIDLMDNGVQGKLPDSLAQLTNANTVYFDGNDGLECPLSDKVSEWLAGVQYHANPCANESAL